MAVVIDISFDPALAILIADFARVDFSDMKEPLTKIVHDVMAPSIERNFMVGGRPKWAPLADATKWNRNPTGGRPELIAPGTRGNKPTAPSGAQILVATGTLMDAASSSEAWTITDQDATAENLGEAPYGVFHQSGTSRMPARPFFVIQDDDENKAVEIFEDWAMKKLDGWGF